MYGVAAQEQHVAEQHPHMEEHLLLSRCVVVLTTLVHVHHVAVGDQAVLEVGEAAGWAEGGVEEERHGRVLTQVHALVEELDGLQV